MGPRNQFSQRDERLDAGFHVLPPVTAIPPRFTDQRDRVLRILQRWSDSIQAGRLHPGSSR